MRLCQSVLHQQRLPHFNPRTREGCDRASRIPITCRQTISIHAPVKGATSLHWELEGLPSYFNPRTREGCDFWGLLRIAPSPHFNPRTREGCDVWCLSSCTRHQIDFNPRTREGCDLCGVWFLMLEPCISIHAPVKGATYRQ